MVLRLALLIAIAIAVPLRGAALFPSPIHLVRQIEEPSTGAKSTVDEYCEGNRIVSVTRGGTRITIADYAAQELTEIARDRHEYSVTSFAELARATQDAARFEKSQAATTTPASWQTRLLGARSSLSGRSVDAYEISRPEQTIEIAFDRSVPLTRGAAEVLLGGAYPSRRGGEHESMMQAARGNAGGRAVASLNTAPADDVFSLPVEQTVTRRAEGTSVVIRIVVTRIDAALIPRELLSIEPDAKLVESRLTRMRRELAASETLSSRRQP